MKLIELTKYTDTILLVNINNILSIKPYSDGSEIEYSRGGGATCYYYVKETIDEIKAILSANDLLIKK